MLNFINSNFIILIVALIIFGVHAYFNYNNDKKRDEFLKTLQVGDEILMNNSIIGTIIAINCITCEISTGNITVKVLVNSIEKRINDEITS